MNRSLNAQRQFDACTHFKKPLVILECFYNRRNNNERQEESNEKSAVRQVRGDPQQQWIWRRAGSRGRRGRSETTSPVVHDILTASDELRMSSCGVYLSQLRAMLVRNLLLKKREKRKTIVVRISYINPSIHPSVIL
ncbi:unnamed protein product [Trichogramma brassicae]|uniref:Uncharacterized protein n=1 Tax=Trichogramma brassicae TaxID=86971 RepID=A0A6H5IF33_9HYME|nr:unnamed protein product [Trichogramma brassicae]